MLNVGENPSVIMFIFFNNVYNTYVLTSSAFAALFLCVFSFMCHKLTALVILLLKALLTGTKIMGELVSGRSKLGLDQKYVNFLLSVSSLLLEL